VADRIIDLGPEGGDEGGRVIATGTPEQVVAADGSYTGDFLKGVLPRIERASRDGGRPLTSVEAAASLS
jgi:excinuclease ABC subunit A